MMKNHSLMSEKNKNVKNEQFKYNSQNKTDVELCHDQINVD